MKKELWLRLHEYRFDDLVPAHLGDHVVAMFGHTDASTHAFAHKLARKQGWTTSFALRAINEYKKFVYLGIVADFAVTPPRVIDAVWHEHLLFSRAYRRFCEEVLGRVFDHDPELVPAQQQTDVFQAQYDATLALYASEFNAAPPADVWGESKFTRRTDGDVAAPFIYSASDDVPLHQYFDSGTSDSSSADFGFGGGGGFSGGGGGSDWGSDSSSTGSESASTDSGSSDSGSTDSGSSDSGSSDSGTSCSSGSSCSSSCGSS